MGEAKRKRGLQAGLPRSAGAVRKLRLMTIELDQAVYDGMRAELDCQIQEAIRAGEVVDKRSVTIDQFVNFGLSVFLAQQALARAREQEQRKQEERKNAMVKTAEELGVAPAAVVAGVLKVRPNPLAPRRESDG